MDYLAPVEISLFFRNRLYGTARGYFDYLAPLVLDSVGCIIIGYCIGDTIQLIICDSFRKFVSE